MNAAFNVDTLREHLPDLKAGWVAPPASWLPYRQLYAQPRVLCPSVALLRSPVADCVVQYYPTPQAVVQGTVVLMHGYMDHVGLYQFLIAHLNEQGWGVLTLDLPGHGLSTGERYAINQFADYADVLDQLLREASAQLTGPVVLMGQSTGAAIILKYLQRTPTVAGSILLAPLIRPKQYRFIRFKYHIGHRFLSRVARFYGDNSHDADFQTFLREQDPLQWAWVPVSWVGAMLAWVEEIEAATPLLTPLTVIQGTEDTTVDWQHNMTVLKRVCPSSTITLLERARHHLVNEAPFWREQVFHQISTALTALTDADPVRL